MTTPTIVRNLIVLAQQVTCLNGVSPTACFVTTISQLQKKPGYSICSEEGKALAKTLAKPLTSFQVVHIVKFDTFVLIAGYVEREAFWFTMSEEEYDSSVYKSV